MKVREYAKTVLEQSDRPLSYKQIPVKGRELGLEKELEYHGKTDLSQNIYSSITQDITTNQNSVFCKFSSNPVLFGLKSKNYAEEVIGEAVENAINQENLIENDKGEIVQQPENDYTEADLHIPLVSFLASHEYFNCLTKTIAQQRAKHAEKKGLDEWTYPDLIGVYFPYNKGDFNEMTLTTIRHFNINIIRVYSFEVKKSLSASDIRQCYFQAVSNSSWAHEGYLVAAEISDEASFTSELELLNNAFGIGVIKLDIEDPSRSSILLPAKRKEALEFHVLDKLIGRSDEVRELFKTISNSEKIGEVTNREFFDKAYSYDEYSELTNEGKNLKGKAGRKK